MTAGIAEEDSNLTVFNTAGGAGILALHADRAGSLLEEAALIKDQHRLLIAQVFDNIVLENSSGDRRAPHRRPSGCGSENPASPLGKRRRRPRPTASHSCVPAAPEAREDSSAPGAPPLPDKTATPDPRPAVPTRRPIPPPRQAWSC